MAYARRLRGDERSGTGGVALVANRVCNERVDSMTLTGAAKVKGIQRNMIA